MTNRQKMRNFVLQRAEDVSGTSGTGIVAEGCEFSSGWCAITWLTAIGTYAWYPNIKAIDMVHGHEGKTKVVWIDENGLQEHS